MRPTSDMKCPDLNDHDNAILAAMADAWLPTADPASRGQIRVFLGKIAISGADPIAELRDGMDRWFGVRAAVALPARTHRPRSVIPEGLPLEPLMTLRRPTLWPQRPKRLADELLSSWLWRTALAAGVPPYQFARETLGAGCDDADRYVSLTTLRRLAQVTGQRPEHLAGGLLRRVPEATYDTASALAESVVLADECFLLTRDGSSRRGRIKPMLQYCPRCLQTDARPYFRRAWRFAHIAVCLEHGCQLHDRCWHCDSPVAPLTQRGIDPIPRCSSCEAVLAEATASPSLARPRQAALQALLEYLALHIPPHQRAPHLDALARRFGSAMRGRVALRGTAVAGLFPASMALWFGRPVDARHAQALQALAEGVNPASAAAAARQKALRERRAAKTKRAIRDSDLAQDSRHKSLLDYSATAQTSIWKLIEGHLNRMEASADHGAQSADQNR